MLARSDPVGHRRLMDLAEEDVRERRRFQEQLVGIERTAPALPATEEAEVAERAAPDEGDAP
jgi:hypothetical protein